MRLQTRGIALDALADLTRDGLRGDRRFRIPRGFCGRIRSGHAPHLHQVIALNELTGIGLYECLALFGHDLENIPLLQAVLHRHHTIPLPTTIYDYQRRIQWPGGICDDADLDRGEFVPDLASRMELARASTLDAACPPHSMYFRVGRDDRHLVPVVIPGTIVRIDLTDREPPTAPHRFTPRPVYVVAHLRGLTCTYVDWIDNRRIALVPAGPGNTPTLYRLDDEAIVLGRVRTELRPLTSAATPVARTGHDHGASRLVRPDSGRQTVGRYLRSAREAIGMTHREAHEISTMVARAYGDRRFAIGLGTLSDWESQDDLPLQIPHVVSLAVCYAVSFGDLLRAAKIVSDDHFESQRPNGNEPTWNGGLDALPPALLHAARVATGLPALSWDDVFRCGTHADSYDRSLDGARYLFVNTRRRRPGDSVGSTTIDRPLYVLADAQGRHICSGCFAHGEHLYIQPDPCLQQRVCPVRRENVSIRGRIVAALRCR
jgi:hypothetical protein